MAVEGSTGTPVEFPDDRVNRACNPEYIGNFYYLSVILVLISGAIFYLLRQDSADPAGFKLNNLDLKLADAINAGSNLVADLNRTNSIGRSGINEVAGCYLIKL